MYIWHASGTTLTSVNKAQVQSNLLHIGTDNLASEPVIAYKAQMFGFACSLPNVLPEYVLYFATTINRKRSWK